MLVINDQVIDTVASPVTEFDAKALGFELGSSSSQGVVEALAIIMALHHWGAKLAGMNVQITIQSEFGDSFGHRPEEVRSLSRPEFLRRRVGCAVGAVQSGGCQAPAHPRRGKQGCRLFEPAVDVGEVHQTTRGWRRNHLGECCQGR